MRTLSILVVSIFAWALAAPVYAAELIVSDASGRPGETVTISVSLNAQGDQVQGTQNDIHFDFLVQIRATMDGRPDCMHPLNVDNWKLGVGFRPTGCAPGVDCNGMRAQLLDYEAPTLDPGDVLGDGASLYTCNVTIDAKAAPGDYALTCDGTILSDPNGYPIPNSRCGSGTITVLPPPPPELIVSDVSGHPGETVTFDVRLASHGTDVLGTQNDIAFGADVAIAARPGGRPACRFDDSVYVQHLGSTSLAFGPYQCGGNCDYVRALILATASTDPIADGTLYTCTVPIAADAEPGRYPLLCTNTYLSNVAGTIAGTACRSSVVTVLPGCAVSDCNADGQVTIDELITGIDIAQEIVPLDSCAAMDINGDGAVTIDELVVAYNNALFGCGGN